MPARIIEELTSRKKEKIATFLTFESIVAVIVAFMPIFMISSSWPLLTRVPLCLAAAVAGYAVTLELHGLPLYEHALWTARGLFRLRVHGNRVVPEDLPGAIPAPDEDKVIAASGPIELVRRAAVVAPRLSPHPGGPVLPAATTDDPEAAQAHATAGLVTD
ncbi:MAG: hypothetical protein HGA45_01860 [Chloroflexales bacterium]|nr:hypothetical protein [Chloroflexales bacterium]